MLHSVYIALGSNLGDRLATLQSAVQALQPEVTPRVCSSVYDTPPWGYLDQPTFLNQVLLGTTDLTPQNLLTHLKKTEVNLGRVKTFKNGPRVIDLDLLLFDDEIIDSPPLVVPHPHLHERAFVLVPLAEIAPDLVHPVLRQSIRDLLSRVDATGIIWYAPSNCSSKDK